ncbi:hypothetical protein [Methylobacterium brachiatum]|jgi:hypothetical protein|uniref:hypothetical protein n=1 Tax=Methylobacterium brachiatum TaxID=269660 RepID=UPI00244B65B1|nr:hypothetical protein [Methylobacterium brachiatum]MDH2312373.1 hypothetical protein [Methylobacterium brachiatum]
MEIPRLPPTDADLGDAGRISSQEIVAAIDADVRDSWGGPYRFASGHTLDLAALVSAPPTIATVDRSSPVDAGIRSALAAAIMAAHPTPP